MVLIIVPGTWSAAKVVVAIKLERKRIKLRKKLMILLYDIVVIGLYFWQNYVIIG